MQTENLESQGIINKMKLESFKDFSYREKRSLLQPTIYNSKGDIVITTGHKTFDRQTNLITAGNVVANTMVGGHIRAYDNVTMGAKRGDLQKYDLNKFIKMDGFHMLRRYFQNLASEQEFYIYAFFHKRNDEIIYHGFIITDEDYVYKTTLCVGPTYKSYDILDEVQKYVSIKPNLIN